MKKLLLYRHAKSSWDNPFQNDHDRPLALRGLRDAPFMAQRLKKKNIIPDIIMSSDAIRAKTTALITAENLHFPKKHIAFTSSLYDASSQTILSEIRKTSDKHDVLFLFGHNPGLTDAIEQLGGQLENLPTCGQFGFLFEVESWKDIHPDNAKEWFLDFPKNSA